MSPASQTITYGTNAITYAVTYSDRTTLDISVHPNAQVIVTAPFGADLAAIEQRVQRRARWILKQQQYFSQFTPRTPPANTSAAKPTSTWVANIASKSFPPKSQRSNS